MEGREVAIFVLLTVPLVVLGAIGGAFAGKYLNGIDRRAEEMPPGIVYDIPGLLPNQTGNVTVRLANSPYGETDNFGTGGVYVIVNYRSSRGHLNEAKTYAEVTPRSTDGIDLCQSVLVFEDFYIVAPVGGATNSSSNVTYASDSYPMRVTELLPGGQQCSLRAGTEVVYDVMVCGEMDGRLDLPRTLEDGTTIVDNWDFCLDHTHRGTVPPLGWI